MSMLENLENIEKQGIRAFVKTEKARWACKKCGGIVCVHRYVCSSCGEKVKFNLNDFSSPVAKTMNAEVLKKPKIIAFIKRQTQNSRPSVAKRAQQMLS